MIGQGQIDFRSVVSRLETLGYNGTWALEYELTTEPPEIGLRKWHDYVVSL